ncbi:MAG: sulfotransferase domain-containing protein [Chloroflexota bacterium]|nr:sulfotransferase domain-containing protein [Chloroflexota bacterium]
MVTKKIRDPQKRMRKMVWRRLESGDVHLRQPPGFIIIGAQKGGTTSLHRYLTEHPDVGGSVRKEVHFFSWFYAKGMDWYLAHFPQQGKHAVVGEASTSYVSDPEVPARVREAVPEVKLIVLLRNPIDRAYSQYQMNVRKEFEPLSFEEAIAAELERLRAAPDRSSEQWRHASYLTRGLYADQLTRWLAVFPREQLLVLQSEAFFARPQEGLARSLEFLGQQPWQPPEYEVYNLGTYGGGMGDATRARLAEYYAPHNQRLYDMMGIDYGAHGWNDE